MAMGLLLLKVPMLFWNARDDEVMLRRRCDGWKNEDDRRPPADDDRPDANNDRYGDDAAARHKSVDREAVAIIV